MESQQTTGPDIVEPASLLSLSWSLIAVGAVLRIASWLADASLFVDEAMVSLNVMERSWWDLLLPLNYNQVAPLGFLWLQKAVLVTAGDSERALRFAPLMSSLIALPLFDRLARRWLSPAPAVIALAVFALALPLSYFAAEAKPYSIDVTIAVATLLFADIVRQRGLGGIFGVAFALWGALAVWLSYPSVILLVAVGLVRVSSRLRDRDIARLLRESPVYVTWVVSLGAHWWLAINVAGDDPFFKAHFSRFVLPLIPTSPHELRALSTAYFRMFKMVLGLDYPGIAGFAFAIGWLAIVRRNFAIASLATAPILVAWVLSNRQIYPFEGRLILYLAPILCVGVGAGAWELVERTRETSRVVGAAFLVMLLALPLDASVARLRNPRLREEIRPVLEHVSRQIEPGDSIYVYYGAQYAYRYYSDRLGLPDEIELDSFVISPSGTTTRSSLAPTRRVALGPSSRRDWKVYIDDLQRLNDRGRVWFVFSHVWALLGIDEQELILFHLDHLGARRLDEIREPGAAAFLYDLNPSGQAPIFGRRPDDDPAPPDVAKGRSDHDRPGS